MRCPISSFDALPGAHFLCDTLDITRPFPSYRPVKEPSWDFVWNRWMSAPFRNLGLDHLCPPLLQVGHGAVQVLCTATPGERAFGAPHAR
jgi:hypothetical protein